MNYYNKAILLQKITVAIGEYDKYKRNGDDTNNYTRPELAEDIIAMLPLHWTEVSESFTQEMYDDVDATCKNLHTQDNRITDQPMFLVQVRARHYGIDTNYTYDSIWAHSDDSEYTITDLRYKRLELLFEGGRQYNENEPFDPDDYYEVGYIDIWEFVTACFTEAACKDYIERMSHRHSGPLRIYAESSYRNYEYQFIRKMLMNRYPEMKP